MYAPISFVHGSSRTIGKKTKPGRPGPARKRTLNKRAAKRARKH